MSKRTCAQWAIGRRSVTTWRLRIADSEGWRLKSWPEAKQMTDQRAADLMAVAMARLLRDGEVVFQGVNSVLPMVAIAVARRLHAPGLTYVNIAGGINPDPRFATHSSTDPELVRGFAGRLEQRGLLRFLRSRGHRDGFSGSSSDRRSR